jgi:hypothetical protein
MLMYLGIGVMIIAISAALVKEIDMTNLMRECNIDGKTLSIIVVIALIICGLAWPLVLIWLIVKILREQNE